jgi:hypothetical protein
LIPAGRQYRRLHNQSTGEDYSDGEYFNPNDEDDIGILDSHLEEVVQDIELNNEF